MRIIVATYFHERFPMYEVHAMGVKRLREVFGVIPVVVCSSEAPHEEFVKKCGFDYYEHANRPLGTKANYTARLTKNYDPDYVIFLDADDIISNTLMIEYMKCMEEGYDFIGVKDIYFYSLNPKRIKYGVFGHWGYEYRGPSNKNLGMAKCLSRSMLDKIDWKPFNDRVNSGLDGTMRARISPHKPKIAGIKVRENNLFCVDVKTQGNLNGIGNFELLELDPDMMYNHLPHDEVEAIKSLKKPW